MIKTAGYPSPYLAFTTASPPYHIRSTNQLHPKHRPELHQLHQLQPELNHLHPKHQPELHQLHQLPPSKLQHINPSNRSASQLHLPSSGSQPYLASNNQPYLGSKPTNQPYGKPSSSQPYHVKGNKNFHLMQSQTLPRLGGGQTFPRRCINQSASSLLVDDKLLP